MEVEHVLLFLVGAFLVYHMMKGCDCKEGWINAASPPTDDHCVLKESATEDIANNLLRQQDELIAKCSSANDLPGNVPKGRMCQGSRYERIRDDGRRVGPTTDPNWRNVDYCKWENGTCSIDTNSPSWNSLEQASVSELRDKNTKCESANQLLARQLPGRKCRGDDTTDPEWSDVDYCEVSNEPGYPWPPGQTGPPETQPDFIPGQTGPPETQPDFIPGQTGPPETQPGFIPGQTGPASTYDPKAWCMEHTQRKLDAGLIDTNTFWNYYRACQSEY